MKFILTTMFYCPLIVKMGGQFLFLNSSLDIVAKICSPSMNCRYSMVINVFCSCAVCALSCRINMI